MPIDATRPRIEPPLELISPIPTLQPSLEPNPLLASTEMPTDFMEHEEAATEKQAGVEEVDMQDALQVKAEAEEEAEADEEADDELEQEESEDLITHYFHVTESQSHYDDNWLTVLWSFQDHEILLRYRMEALEYWEKMSGHQRGFAGQGK